MQATSKHLSSVSYVTTFPFAIPCFLITPQLLTRG
jgi:uncharacterized transporter YbjL